MNIIEQLELISAASSNMAVNRLNICAKVTDISNGLKKIMIIAQK